MTELTDFLLARIADDEAVANLARPDDHLKARDHSFLRVEKARGYAHVAATSGRVLAECEAKRRIVGHHTPHRGDDEFPLCSICTEVGPDAQGWPCLTLRALALPYADHPDYQQEWKP